MAYNVLINETQRARIQRALELLDEREPLTGDDATDPDLEFLLPCVRDLPKEESENPGILHGLCL